MRKKSSEEEQPHPANTRRVILIKDSGDPQQPLRVDNKGFSRTVEPNTNQNQNGVNMPTPPMVSIQESLALGHSHMPRQRVQPNPVVPGQMELIVGSLIQMSEEVSSLVGRLDALENKFLKIEDKPDQVPSHSKKKLRRRAEEIQKNFLCPEPQCGKAYGSQVSLNLHLKLKHPLRSRQAKSQGLSSHRQQDQGHLSPQDL